MKQEILNTLIDLKKRNNNLIITGSTALDLVGCKIRRDVTDIDLYLESGRHYYMGGCIQTQKEDYEEENYYYSKYINLKNNIKIDIFEPVSSEKCIIRNNEESTITVRAHGEVFEVLKPEFVLQFKIQHILSNTSSWETKEKHKEDIIYFLQKNII